jgi:hypothetical protein
MRLLKGALTGLEQNSSIVKHIFVGTIVFIFEIRMHSSCNEKKQAIRVFYLGIYR